MLHKPQTHRKGYNLLKKTVAIIVAASFLVSNVSYALDLSDPSYPRIKVKTITEDKLFLPSNLGYVTDSWIPKNGAPRIIHIQDIHCNYDAQVGISKIIGYLNDKYSVSTINLEGGSGDYDTSLFGKIENVDTRLMVTDNFLRRGLVSGAEFFEINNPGKVRLWGVENEEYYNDNLQAYGNFLKGRQILLEDMEKIKSTITNIKEEIYSDELLEVDRKIESYTEKEGSKEHVRYLFGEASEGNIYTDDLVNIKSVNRAIDLENKIDIKKSESERDLLVEELSKTLSRISQITLFDKTLEFSKNLISQQSYYEYLINKAEDIGLPDEKYTEFMKYKVYAELYSSLDSSLVKEELSILEYRIREALCFDTAQLDLLRLSHDISILNNMFGLALTVREYKDYKKNRQSFLSDNIVNVFSRVAPGLHLDFLKNIDFKNIDRCIGYMEKFYDFSFRRDEAFVENLRFSKDYRPLTIDYRPRGSKTQLTVLITGGFHTGNLMRIFKEKDIPYISIMPEFKNKKDYVCPYLELISGEKSLSGSFLEDIVSSFSLPSAIAIKSFFSSLPVAPVDMDMIQLETDVLMQVLEGREGTIQGGQYAVGITRKKINLNSISNKGAKIARIEYGGKTLFITAIPFFEVRDKKEQITSEKMTEADIKDLIEDLFLKKENNPSLSLGELRNLIVAGGLEQFLTDNKEYEQRLIEALYYFVSQASTYRDSLDILKVLICRGSVEGVSVLVKEIEETLTITGTVPSYLMRALIDTGEISREVLMTRHKDLVEKINRLPVLSGAEERQSDEMFMDWFWLMENGEREEKVSFKRNNIIRYFVLRENIADLIIRIRGIFAVAPEMEEEDIFTLIGDDMKELPLKTRIWFKIGVKKYLRDKKRVKEIVAIARKAGIKLKYGREPGLIRSEVIYPGRMGADSEKRAFVLGLLGFVSDKEDSKMRVIFTPDTVHVIVDDDTYRQLKYRRNKKIPLGVPDNYSEEKTVSTSGGYFEKGYRGYFSGGIDLAGIITFENADPKFRGEDLSVTFRHENEHRFFSGYTESALLTNISFGNILEYGVKINLFSGEDQKNEIEKLIKELMLIYLFPIQNEMIAKIADGQWFGQGDHQGWFSFYEGSYRGSDEIKAFMESIKDEGLRKQILDETFLRVKNVIRKITSKVDNIIMIEAGVMLSRNEGTFIGSLKDAMEWTALFLQTIPATVFHRLDTYLYILSARMFIDRIFVEQNGKEEYVKRVADILKRADAAGDISGAMAGMDKILETFDINMGDRNRLPKLWNEICQTEIDLCILDAQRSFQENKSQGMVIRKRSAERLRWLARTMYNKEDKENAIGLNELADMIEKENSELDLSRFQDMGFSVSLGIEKEISSNTEKKEWEKLGISSFRAASHVRSKTEEYEDIILIFSNGKEVRFRKENEDVFRLSLEDLVRDIRNKDVIDALKDAYLSFKYQDAGEQERNKAAEMIEDILNEISLKEYGTKTDIKSLVNRVRNGDIEIDIVDVDRAVFDVYADKESGIQINSKYSHDPEKITRLIIKGVLLLISDDYGYAEDMAKRIVRTYALKKEIKRILKANIPEEVWGDYGVDISDAVIYITKNIEKNGFIELRSPSGKKLIFANEEVKSLVKETMRISEGIINGEDEEEIFPRLVELITRMKVRTKGNTKVLTFDGFVEKVLENDPVSESVVNNEELSKDLMTDIQLSALLKRYRENKGSGICDIGAILENIGDEKMIRVLAEKVDTLVADAFDWEERQDISGDVDDLYRVFKNIKRQKNEKAFIYVDEKGVIQAYSNLYFIVNFPEYDKRAAIIDTLSVSKDKQKKHGIGTKIMDHMVEECLSSGIKKIRVTVESLPFYLKYLSRREAFDPESGRLWSLEYRLSENSEILIKIKDDPIDEVLEDERFVGAVIEIQKKTDESWKEQGLVVGEDLELKDLADRIIEGSYTTMKRCIHGDGGKIFLHSHPGNVPLPSKGDLRQYKDIGKDSCFMIVSGEMLFLMTEMNEDIDIEEYGNGRDKVDLIKFLENNAKVRMFRIKEASLEEMPKQEWEEELEDIRKDEKDGVMDRVEEYTREKARKSSLDDIEKWISELREWIEGRTNVLYVMVAALEAGLNEDAEGFVQQYSNDFMNMLLYREEIEFSYTELRILKEAQEERTQNGFVYGKLDAFVADTLNDFFVHERTYYRIKDHLDRRKASIKTFNSAERRADIVKVIVGVPSGMSKNAEEFIHDANRDLCRSGFGVREDNNQIIGFVMSDNDIETQRNLDHAVEKAQGILRKDMEKSTKNIKGHIVVFAPYIEKDKGSGITERRENITIIKDAYTDVSRFGNVPPDIMVRCALARLIAFYYNGNDKAFAIDSINRFLDQMTGNEDIKDISDLLSVPLKIRALAFNSIKEWKIEQEAVSKSL